MLTSYVLASLLQFTVIILGEKKSIFMSWNQVFKKKRKKTKEQANEELVLLGRNLVSLANCLNHFGLCGVLMYNIIILPIKSKSCWIVQNIKPVAALLFFTHTSFIPEVFAITYLQFKHETHSILQLVSCIYQI